MKQDGFTVIEVLATIVVAGIFITSIYTLMHDTSLSSIYSGQRFRADSLSYANLRKYANGRPPSWFSCPSNQTDSVTLFSSNTVSNQLPPPVTQTVVADAPYGCSDNSSGLALRVTSTVIYGPNSNKMVNTTYATY